LAQRADLREALAPLAHLPTWLAVSAEREVSRSMGGSCSMPLAAFALWQGDLIELRAAWGDLATKGRLIQAEGRARVATLSEARELGAQVAAQLIAAGASVQT
jgi:hydroxymethylbilane synthase